ncbi:LSM domain protein [Staphylococcus pseudintermedius]|uniref:LSM domain protein n=1 Tax=Staphylococcus pseudintermedius TaxID=283734 RepID=UPI0010329F02|nr:LSM domain protein [Staphylococcus pseudintermedius]EGQ0321886.1 LSM domain protein [Staphylococcus pseudintermedius]EGQ0359566.1 LSM domain protein [Staphylococcus pseudintermedius]EGQ1294882.1 LSM domain protein [Staphylococcus pseudintermedius]EGQ1595306.1 LSM domain protein [Staphylococcus pseudintermedius]EGQ1770887.1 LSM domain protein [Staphylococcus pseudintermedius]
MKLWTYVGEKVLVKTTDGQQFIGEVTNYEDEVANDSGEDSIHLSTEHQIYDIEESQIKSIKILD